MFQAICKCIMAVSLWLGVGANISNAQPPKEITNSIGMKLALIPKGAVSDPTGPKKGSDRVYRGGCWNYEAAFCRSAGRD